MKWTCLPWCAEASASTYPHHGTHVLWLHPLGSFIYVEWKNTADVEVFDRSTEARDDGKQRITHTGVKHIDSICEAECCQGACFKGTAGAKRTFALGR